MKKSNESKKKVLWGDLMLGISFCILKDKVPIQDEKLKVLFEFSNSFSKCFRTLHWLELYSNKIWEELFYEKLKDLAKPTFLHQRKLAQKAKDRKDSITFNQAMAKMIGQLHSNGSEYKRKQIIRLLPEEDSRFSFLREAAKKKQSSFLFYNRSNSFFGLRLQQQLNLDT